MQKGALDDKINLVCFVVICVSEKGNNFWWLKLKTHLENDQSNLACDLAHTRLMAAKRESGKNPKKTALNE